MYRYNIYLYVIPKLNSIFKINRKANFGKKKYIDALKKGMNLSKSFADMFQLSTFYTLYYYICMYIRDYSFKT